jgi:trans-aconitate methyltransferase
MVPGCPVLDAFQPHGSVLELACGPGVWTGQLLRYATDVTAVDASPEMLAIAAARFGSQRVRFVQADLFIWKPDSQTNSWKARLLRLSAGRSLTEPPTGW